MKCVFFFLFLCTCLYANEVPIAYKGRFRPLDVYVKLWAKEANVPVEEAQERLWDHPSLLVLPGRYTAGEWLPLGGLARAENTTLYSDATFRELQRLYMEATQNPSKKELLFQGPYREGATSSLTYPTKGQLRAESLYDRGPWILVTLLLYLTAGVCFLLGWPRLGIGSMGCAFLLHTLLIGLRCYILGRPPVSSMFETILYVPWIAVLLGGALSLYFRSTLALLGAALLAFLLLLLLPLTGMHNSFDNVQAVLNSRYWLIVHVLLVVGSYGAFLLAGILAHFYLIRSSQNSSPNQLGTLVEQSIYLGVALLIPGTLLGGVWAAESWGRFWDWDPKEAWAFISICFYLLLIHAYTFKHMGQLGLAVGAVIGIQVIVFTWYGVNYILGTGLHSYGFGQGGELSYALFVVAETLFLLWIFLRKKISHTA
jgi:ABC-type transport system involved in cytochrome c biogenesis permease subunit